jgi:hypothetical protein
MKSVMSLSAIIIFSFSALLGEAHAQSDFGQAGASLIGGSASYSSTAESEGSSSFSEMSLSPTYGYFLLDGLLLEGGPIFSYSASSFDPLGTGKPITLSTSELGLLVSPAYYFELSEDLFAYGRVQIQANTISREASSDTIAVNDQGDTSDLRYGLGAGIAMAFGAESGGVVQLGFDYISRSTTSTEIRGESATSETSNLSLSTRIGFFF